MATKQVQCEGTRGKYYAIVLSYVKNSYNVETNKSNITLKGIIKSTNSSYSYYGFDNDGELSIKGDVVSGKKTTSYRSVKTGSKTSKVTTSGVTLVTWTGDVQHENNGNLSLSVKFDFDTSYSYLSATKAEVTWNLSQNRLATVTSASNFTDEENPTLEFTNPGGFTVYPYLTFYDKDGKLIYELTRTTESATSPYTWEITNEERQTIWGITNKQSSYKVNVGVSTYNGSTKLGNNSKSQTMTYVNAEPSQATTFIETNQKVIDLLGNSADTIVQNVSKLRLTSIPDVKKGATVSKISFEHNAISIADTTSPYEHEFTPVNSKFKVTIDDSRQYSVPTEYTKSIIEYLPIDISSREFKRENPTSSNIILNAQIRYVQTNFGSTPNVPTIQWKLGENGQLNTLSADDYTIDAESKKIIISNLILNDVLSYKEQGEFYLYANDLLTSDVETKYTVTKGIPTFDAGEHDFNVNGDLTISNEDGENPVNVLEQINFLKSQKVLWEGAFYMHGTQEVDLSKTPISDQPNGIVLIFSAYDNGAKDWDFKQFFISKKSVELINGAGYDFILNSKDFGKVACKYLYIHNDKITGHENNTASGTGASGIKYTNSGWVLRYVIGV